MTAARIIERPGGPAAWRGRSCFKGLAACCLLGVLLAGGTLPAPASAGGFEVRLQSSSAASVAGAGISALAEDASTIAYNPAGMTYLEGFQTSAGTPVILPNTSFDNAGTLDATGGVLVGNQNTEDKVAVLPSFFGVWSSPHGFSLGLGVFSPFGQSTQQDNAWVGRYFNTEAKLTTYNFNPSAAYAVTDWLSLGLGFNAQFAKLKLGNALDFGSICFGTLGLGPGVCPALGLLPQGADGDVEIEVEDWGFGFNLGAILEPFEGTRLGLAYRSSVDFDFEGDADFTVPAAAAVVTAGGTLFQDTGVSGEATFPETLSASLYHELDDRWTLLGDLTWTRWSRNQELRGVFDNRAQPDLVETANWHNSIRASVGATFDVDDTLTLRGGVAFDESPIPDDFRSARLPSEDTVVLGLGATYEIEDWLSLAFAYVHTRQWEASIRQSSPTAGTLVGDYHANAHILGADFHLRF